VLFEKILHKFKKRSGDEMRALNYNQIITLYRHDADHSLNYS